MERYTDRFRFLITQTEKALRQALSRIFSEKWIGNWRPAIGRKLSLPQAASRDPVPVIERATQNPLRNPRKASQCHTPFPEVPLGVSVLIPTRNGGPEFDRCLRAIRDQQGLGGIELIVLDSSSTDGTPDLARKYGASVMSIPVERFNHGLTRNELGDLANHSLLLFMVQDAFLIGSYALRDLASQLLENPRCAAVSARQIPRTDADLFASFSNLTHEIAMEWHKDQFTEPVEPGTLRYLPALKRRRLTALDNVCCLVRREVWRDLRYRPLPFAEDLEFGRRCVESGWGLGHSHSVAVIHSHNRSAQYHLRRHVVDRLTISNILDESVPTNHAVGTPGQVAAASRWFVRTLYSRFQGFPEATLDTVMENVQINFEITTPDLAKLPFNADIAGDDELTAIDRLLAHIANTPVDHQVLKLLLQGWEDFLRQPHLREFTQSNRWVKGRECREFVSKLGAVLIGATLGNSVSQYGLEGDRLKEFTSGI